MIKLSSVFLGLSAAVVLAACGASGPISGPSAPFSGPGDGGTFVESPDSDGDGGKSD